MIGKKAAREAGEEAGGGYQDGADMRQRRLHAELKIDFRGKYIFGLMSGVVVVERIRISE